jgi:hypothetical protein
MVSVVEIKVGVVKFVSFNPASAEVRESYCQVPS